MDSDACHALCTGSFSDADAGASATRAALVIIGPLRGLSPENLRSQTRESSMEEASGTYGITRLETICSGWKDLVMPLCLQLSLVSAGSLEDADSSRSGLTRLATMCSGLNALTSPLSKRASQQFASASKSNRMAFKPFKCVAVAKPWTCTETPGPSSAKAGQLDVLSTLYSSSLLRLEILFEEMASDSRTGRADAARNLLGEADTSDGV